MPNDTNFFKKIPNDPLLMSSSDEIIEMNSRTRKSQSRFRFLSSLIITLTPLLSLAYSRSLELVASELGLFGLEKKSDKKNKRKKREST